MVGLAEAFRINPVYYQLLAAREPESPYHLGSGRFFWPFEGRLKPTLRPLGWIEEAPAAFLRPLRQVVHPLLRKSADSRGLKNVPLRL